MNPDLGVGEDDGDSWGGGWGENTFLEFEQPTLTERAGNWCTEKGVSASERTALIRGSTKVCPGGMATSFCIGV